MFWLVSGKGRGWPFCPHDEWAWLTGHFSLLLFFSPSFPPFFPHPPPPASHSLQPKATICFFQLGAWRRILPGDRFIVVGTRLKCLKPSVTPGVPLPGRRDWSAIYICWGPSKGQLLYISTTGDSVCISQKIALTTLSSWKARIFSFLKTYLDFFLDVS